MQLSAASVILGCISLVAVCSGRHSISSSHITLTDIPCTPRYASTCGEAELLRETTSPVTEGYGPNVCDISKDYQIQTFSYVEAEYCSSRGRRQKCRTYCTKTENCTGPMINFTKTETDCCDGFAVDLDDKAAPGHTFLHPHAHRRSKDRILRQSGCTIMVSDSLIDCLLDLNLESFIVKLIQDAPDAIPDLDSSEDEMSQYTIFAVNASDSELSQVDVRGLIVNGILRRVPSVVLPTLREDVFLHVVKGVKSRTYYVNGVEIEDFNACQARNGMVHIVNSPIPQPTLTIAETLRDDGRFSTFLQLLDASSTIMHLDLDEAGKKSHTLLAPTDEAFEDLPENIVECLLREENEKFLNRIMLTHISSQAQYSATLSQLTRLYTFSRFHLSVRTDEEGNILLTKDRIPLEEADIAASNGVIHAIPEVITPPKVDLEKICGEEEDGSGGM